MSVAGETDQTLVVDLPDFDLMTEADPNYERFCF